MFVTDVNSQIKTYPGRLLTAQDFSIMMDRLPVIRSGILSGCVVTKIESGYSISSGWLVVRGRLVYVNTGTFDIPSTYLGEHKLVAHVLLGASGEPSKIEIYNPSEDFSDTDGFNTSNSGNAYCTIAVIDTSTTPPTITQNLYPERGAESEIILSTNGWNSDGTYTINDPAITETSDQRLIPNGVTITAEQLTALQYANIVGHSQGVGWLKLKAFGTAPKVDIPVILKYYGG